MMDIARRQSANRGAATGKQRNYAEITEYLDKHWTVPTLKTLDRMKALDQALGSPSTKLNTILVGGTNGKSLTIHLTAKLLKEEGLKIGTFYSPHILTYNERIALNQEAVSNKLFTELANEVINTAEQLSLAVYSSEILAMMALAYFAEQNVDVAILEATQGGLYSPVNICHAKVATVTRVTPPTTLVSELQLQELIKDMMGIVKDKTYVVSGDQSKTHLQIMHDLTNAQGGNWAMPIRKLAALSYPYEQLHGRCAALAERLAQMFVEKVNNKNATIMADSLLSKQKGQRGRPTIAAKRQAELHPKKTLDQFWKEQNSELPGRFQLLVEKPSILLDTASNIDALNNVLLGIRLLHYRRPIKRLTIIIGAAKDTMHNEEFLKILRYFFKKTSGQLLICPMGETLPGNHEETSWDCEKVANDLKSMKINKAFAYKTFEEAFELAKKSVDERDGLVVVTGSRSIVHSYWRYKGIKKFVTA